MIERVRVAAAATAVAALVAGCAGTTTGSGTMRPSSSAPARSHVASAAQSAIDRAVRTAHGAQKRVLIDFGADWCPDCRQLDVLYRTPTVAPVLGADYVLVHVDVGHWDRNMDVSHTYGDAAKTGIPALVVLDGSGRMLVNTADGSFANARTMAPAQVRKFLVTWAGR